MALNTNILDQLQKWNFVTIEKIGKRRIVTLSSIPNICVKTSSL